jgi:hypothetical protein
MHLHLIAIWDLIILGRRRFSFCISRLTLGVECGARDCGEQRARSLSGDHILLETKQKKNMEKTCEGADICLLCADICLFAPIFVYLRRYLVMAQI